MTVSVIFENMITYGIWKGIIDHNSWRRGSAVLVWALLLGLLTSLRSADLSIKDVVTFCLPTFHNKILLKLYISTTRKPQTICKTTESLTENLHMFAGNTCSHFLPLGRQREKSTIKMINFHLSALSAQLFRSRLSAAAHIITLGQGYNMSSCR